MIEILRETEKRMLGAVEAFQAGLISEGDTGGLDALQIEGREQPPLTAAPRRAERLRIQGSQIPPGRDRYAGREAIEKLGDRRRVIRQVLDAPTPQHDRRRTVTQVEPSDQGRTRRIRRAL